LTVVKSNLDTAPPRFNLVIKGMKFDIAANNSDELISLGILNYEKINKHKDHEMIKVNVPSKDKANDLKTNGLKLFNFRYRVVDYVKPDFVMRCFQCQELGHAIKDCSDVLKCRDCGGDHHVSKCNSKIVLRQL
jgi:hypothetical protein